MPKRFESYLHLPELAVVPDFSGLLSNQGGIQRFLSSRRFEHEIGDVLSLVGNGKHNGRPAVLKRPNRASSMVPGRRT